MSRGDTPLFLLQSTMTMAFSMAVLIGCKVVFGRVMAAFPELRIGPLRAAPDDHTPGEDETPPDDAGHQTTGDEPSDEWPQGEQDWGQASAGWEYSEHASDEPKAP
jgi:hypothetical protein